MILSMATHTRPVRCGWCVVLVLWSLCGCAPAAMTAAMSQPSGTQDDRQVLVGQHTRIGLPSNPTTGYGWSLDTQASTGLEHVALTDEGFKATDSGLVGAPGRRWWTLKGLSSGRASLHFVYRRAWERDSPPAKARTIVVDVH